MQERIAAGMEEDMHEHFLRGDSCQSNKIYPVVERFSLSYSEVGGRSFHPRICWMAS